MALNAKPIELGALRGTIYDFDVVGDVLPMHVHGELDVHISIVARGSFRAHGIGWEMVLACGAVADWKPNQPHEFVAIEDGSRLVNIIKGGAK